MILVKSFVGVRLCLSDPDKEEGGAPGQSGYISIEQLGSKIFISKGDRVSNKLEVKTSLCRE